ncbi:hypothetical protein [Streptomyces microflavus]|uniref:hypothetical protein n=1 Tax=Streptomyces microflavus TaxID=1919 RepID=UPI0033BC9490
MTAAQLVVAMPQPDDSGANTLDRYEWQAAMAAADGLKLYLMSLGSAKRPPVTSDGRILCEYHEDWVVLQGPEAELVSGKHRDPAVGPFTTINQLANEGGLTHLFLRWVDLKEKPTCRLATTHGLAKGDPQSLESAIQALRPFRLDHRPIEVSDDHESSVSNLHEALRKYGAKQLPKSWLEKAEVNLSHKEQRSQTARFLSALTIQVENIGRKHVDFAAPSMYVKPVLDRLGIDAPPESVWNSVLGLFRARMRAAGPNPDGGLPPVLKYTEGSFSADPSSGERALAARIVTVQDIDIAIMTAAANPSAYEPLSPPVRLSRSAVKMRKGGFSNNRIERAEQLRKDFSKYWSGRMSGDPAALVERDRLRRVLLRVSDQADADTAALRPADKWGPAFWERMQEIIDAMPPDKVPPGMDPDLLLGGISELTNACQVWFSDDFDVAAEIERLRDENNGSAA